MLANALIIIGVFTVTLFGVPTACRVLKTMKVPFSNFFYIAVGAAVLTAGVLCK